MAARDPLIDGWRGVSILMVMVGHLLGGPLGGGAAPSIYNRHAVAAWIERLSGREFFPILCDYADSLAYLGVSIFFVISGFVITQHMQIEERRNGSVNVGAFYIRRVFRILPAYYVMILTTTALGLAGLIAAPSDAALRAGAFTCNFDMFRCGWALAHTWSVSAEEQFYLVWPLVFFAPPKYR